MRISFALLLLLFAIPAFAAEDKPQAPTLTYEQKVNIVVEAQKNPSLLELKLEQKDYAITIDAIADQNTDRTQAKGMAHDIVMLTKGLSLDDKPTDKGVIGKGIYNYRVTIKRVDGILLLSATKPAKKKDIIPDPPGLIPQPVQVQPWTRADGNSQSSGANQ